MTCPRCIKGKVFNDDGLTCLNCGWTEPITPLETWKAKRQEPTDVYWKTRPGSKVPPTRMYDDPA
jgi:hypothetical protein